MYYSPFGMQVLRRTYRENLSRSLRCQVGHRKLKLLTVGESLAYQS